jgi:hypothetical protein
LREELRKGESQGLQQPRNSIFKKMHYPHVLYVIFLLLTAKYIIHLCNEDARIEDHINADDERTITAEENIDEQQTIIAEENPDDERYYGDSESEDNDSLYRKRPISLHDRLRIHELMNQSS